MSYPKKFDYYIGIDQTGAAVRDKPKPLYASIWSNHSHTLYSKIKLSALKPETITTLFNDLNLSIGQSKILICVDSVLGLPTDCKTSFHALLRDVKNFKYNSKNFGLETAYNFYKRYLKNKNTPVRQAELKVGANSVFFKHPFQRNIGCGSYRVLKELSQDTSWYQVWPFENQTSTTFTICEGYPSFFWETWLKTKKRDAQFLTQYLVKQKITQKNIKALTVDEADSIVLALGAKHVIENKNALNIKLKADQKKFEGWILGLTQN